MRPDSASRILDAYDECFKAFGQPNFETGINFICEELKKSRARLKAARSRNGLQAMLLKEAEPTEYQLDARVETIRLLPRTLRKGMREAAKELPGGKGGRQHVLTLHEHKEIIVQITELKDTTTLSIAVRRMADQYGVSESKIRKVWQSRPKIATFSDGA